MGVRVKGVLAALLMFVVALAALPLPVVGAQAPSLSEIKDAVSYAYYFYIVGLTRDLGSYKVISEYPALPIVVYEPQHGWWWVPGMHYPVACGVEGCSYTDAEFSSSQVSSDGTGTAYSWVMDLVLVTPLEDGSASVDRLMRFVVTEYRSPSLSYVDIYVESSMYEDAKIYFAGEYLGTATPGASYRKYIYNSPIPSMRTAVRHADVFGAQVLANLAGYDSELWGFASEMMYQVFGYSRDLYDIYNPMLKHFSYVGEVDEPNELHFYDAHWFNYGLGYEKMWDFFESAGWVWREYPAYPYESKVVHVAAITHTSGGAMLLSYMESIGCLLYTSPSPRDLSTSRMPSSA